MSFAEELIWNDSLRSDIKDLADAAIERVFRFLAKEKTYSLSIRPDPTDSGKVWSICLSNNTSDLHIAFVYEGNFLSAVKVAKIMSILLQIFGYIIQSENHDDISYTHEEKIYGESIEKLKTAVHIELYVKSSDVFKSFFFGCKTSNDDFLLMEVGGMTEKSANILCNQFCMILAALGKYVTCPDGSSVTQYGVSEICPDTARQLPSKYWHLAANSLQCATLGKKILDRIDLPSLSVKAIDISPTSKCLLHTHSSGNQLYDPTNIDPVHTLKPAKLGIPAIEIEAYNDSEAELFVKNAVKQFISNFGLIGMKMRIVKKNFLSNGKACISIVIEDASLSSG